MKLNWERGLAFSMRNLTSSRSLGNVNPTVSGRKRKRIPVAMIRSRPMNWNLNEHRIKLKLARSVPKQSYQNIPQSLSFIGKKVRAGLKTDAKEARPLKIPNALPLTEGG